MIKPILDAIVAVIILVIVVTTLLDMVRPYAAYLLVGLAAYLIGSMLYRRYQRW